MKLADYNGFNSEQRTLGDKIIKDAIKKGILPPLNETRCAICGQDKGVRHYHNEDYRPEKVIEDATPLCWRCHMHIHTKHKTTANWKKYEEEVFQGNKRYPPIYTKNWKDKEEE